MKIEDFETKLRQLWIRNGWDTPKQNTWFVVSMDSRYKMKYIRVWDVNTEQEFEAKASNWQDAFENMLSVIIAASGGRA